MVSLEAGVQVLMLMFDSFFFSSLVCFLDMIWIVSDL